MDLVQQVIKKKLTFILFSGSILKRNCIEKMSDNSKIEFYSPPASKEFVEVDPNNILFIIHRRGFITCVCGNVVTKHVCNLQTYFKNLKIKFDLCPKKETCRFCEDIVQWNYERYMNIEGEDKLFCRKCTKEIKSDKGICEDCFCSTCYGHLNDCVCCKFCSNFGQCTCTNNSLPFVEKFD